ncbi:MAG: hypothetical protein VSS75_016090 [Candidatus Parabeggiatoa sp.]|nr:hypothetical protein [Candidatus Parabeggiatoa sp.]
MKLRSERSEIIIPGASSMPPSPSRTRKASSYYSPVMTWGLVGATLSALNKGGIEAPLGIIHFQPLRGWRVDKNILPT